jgi:hypothetical protein
VGVVSIFLGMIEGCAPAPGSVNALVHMEPDQETYFKKEIVPPIEKQCHVKVDCIHYGSVDSMESWVRMHAGAAGLVEVPFEKRSVLLGQGLFRRLDGVVGADSLAALMGGYLLSGLGDAGGIPCLIPRVFETRIMVYCKSKVADAAAAWQSYKTEINGELKKYNGYGLPSNFSLKDDPCAWDFYDLFVVGWVWAHMSYEGKTEGRIGFPRKLDAEIWRGAVDRIFQLGGDSVSAVTMAGDPVVDAFHWDAVYAAANVYNKEMWERSWSESDVLQAFADGDVFLSFLAAPGCFYLHGTGSDGGSGYLKNSEEMGVALMPQGCSVELSGSALPARRGRRSVATSGWFWGIPVSAPDPAQSYAIAAALTSTSTQIMECSRFGMIPVRKEVLGDIPMMFGTGWISRLYEVSLKQLGQNSGMTIPQPPNGATIAARYRTAWNDIVAGKNWSTDTTIPDRAYIRERLLSWNRPKTAAIVAEGEQRARSKAGAEDTLR